MPASPERRDDPHRQEIVRRVAARAPLGFGVFLFCAAIATAFEFIRFPDRRAWMGSVAAVYVALAVIARALLVRRPAWAIPVLIGFVNAIGVIINVYHGAVDASVAMCVWVLTALLCSSAVILPWGRRAQALASIGALASYPLNLQAPSVDPLAWAAGGAYLLCVVALSVFGASLFSRYVRKDLQLTAALTEREARLQSYFDLSLVGTAVVGPDGGCREVNQEFCRLFGVTETEMLGRPWFDVVRPEERDVATALLTQALAGAPGRLDLGCLGPGGIAMHAAIATRGLPGDDGTIDHALVLAHDITERRQAGLAREESLAHTEAARRAAEEASRAKDVLLAIVSHELRTPLSPILAWADMLHEGGLGAEATSRGLGVIQRSARAQARLIDDMLDMSRIMAGEWDVTFQPVELRAVLLAALDVGRPVADAKGVALESRLGETPVLVSGDPERLQRVVWNLVSNAIAFTPCGGRIDVALERDDGVARVVVHDTGEGIAPDILPHTFEAFSQPNGSATREHGLGLAIVRALVERHGGRVRVESDGAGATFTVELPRLAAEAGTEAEGARAPAGAPMVTGARRPLRGLRVLVVDDDDDSNTVVSTLLAARGAEVRAARSAAGALEITDSWRPHVVMSDIAMPGEDGIALLRALRETIGEVPAIALTAYASSADRRRILAAGFQAHVAKPFDPVHLAAVVEATFQATASA
jgi:PAS domain S-box-containing protein